LTDVGTVLAAALEQVRPALADTLQSTQRVELVTSNVGSLSATLADVAETVELLALFLLLLSLALVAGALVVAPDRRQAAVELGVGAAVVGVLLVVAYSVARSIAVDHVQGPDEQAAARAVWHAFLGDLRTAAWILAISGAAVAATAASLIKPAQFGEPLRAAASWVSTEPRRPALRVLRSAAFVAAGIAVLVEREAVLSLLLTVLGVYLIYEGLSAVLRLVYRPEEHEEEEPEPPRARAIRQRRLATGLAPAVLIAVVVALFLGSGGTTTAAPAKGPCNGRIELCERRLDRVALPATHNSMSVPLPGWYSSEQERPIIDQLSDGIRGLLIDTHYGDRLQNGKGAPPSPAASSCASRPRPTG
jgi:hypothetical protein